MSEALDRVRAICTSFPKVEERLSHGEPTWFVKRAFAMFSTYHHGGPLAVWCAAPLGVQDMLIDSNPDRFFRPPYVGVKGWVGVVLENDPDYDEIAEILSEAYAFIATK